MPDFHGCENASSIVRAGWRGDLIRALSKTSSYGWLTYCGMLVDVFFLRVVDARERLD